MRIAWSGLIFHAVILFWSFEDGKYAGERSEGCFVEAKNGNSRKVLRSTLLLVSLPGLSRSHVGILDTLPGLLTHVRGPDAQTAYLALIAGLDKPPLVPALVDDIFHHTNTTVLAGPLPALTPTVGTKIADADYTKDSGKIGDRYLFDNLKQLLAESQIDGDLAGRLKGESVLFFLRLLGYAKTDSLDTLRQTLRSIADFKSELDKFYGDKNTSVILWGEGEGPLLLWGNRFARGDSQIDASNLTSLVSAILRREVPADSRGILPDDYLDSEEDKAHGLYCNALQLFKLATITQGESDVIAFWSKFNVNEIEADLKEARADLEAGRFKKATIKCRQIAWFCQKQFKRFDAVLERWRVGLMVLSTLAYLTLLLSEFAYDEVHPPKPSGLVYVHMFFCGLSCFLFSLPFITPWPHTYHIYLQIPHLFFWAFLSRWYVWMPKLRMSNIRSITKAWWYALILYLAAELSLLNSMTTSSFFICVLALLPTLPKFSKAPLILTTGWFLTNAALLGALHLPAYTKPETKAINFSATIALCASGFAALWVRPLKDRLLSLFITILVAVGMLAENMALSYKGDIWFLMYVSWPLMLSPFLPLIGERKRFNRIVHVITSTSIVFCLSSARFEGVCFFAVMAVAWLWTLMESYKLKEQINCESIRRSIFLVFLLLIAGQVVKTLPGAYRPFRADEWSHLIDVYREILISGGVLTVFLTMMDSEGQAYTTVVLGMIITAIASLRTTLIPGDLYSIQIRGIVLISAYYFAMILKGNKKVKSEQLIDHPMLQEPNQ